MIFKNNISCINDIILQKYKNWELHILYNKNIDKNIFNNYKLNNNIFINELNNINDEDYIAKSINYGINKFINSDCNYFTWIYDNCIYYDIFLENLIIYKCDFCYSYFKLNNLVNNNYTIIDKFYVDYKDLMNNYNGFGSFLWSKESIKILGFLKEEIKGCEDYEFFIRTFKMLNNKKIKINTIITMEYNYDNNDYFYLNKNKCIFYQNIIKTYYKNNIIFDNKNINFIDYILFINFNKNNLLDTLFIPNYKITTINNIEHFKNINFKQNLSNNEIFHTLSHIKTINFLKYIYGEYFMIYENRNSISYLSLNNHLKDIILYAPYFDILVLHKNNNINIDNIYCKFNDYTMDKNEDELKNIYYCYIITKKSVNTIINYAKYYNGNFILNNTLDTVNNYIFKNVNTYIYTF